MTGFDDDLRGALHDEAWALPVPPDPQGWVRARVRRRRARVLVAGAAGVALLATGAVAVVGGGGSAVPEQLDGPAQVASTVPRPAECPEVRVPTDPLLGDPRWFAYAPLNPTPPRVPSPSPGVPSASCPEVLPSSVPATGQGFDASASLVPVGTPTSSLLCQYAPVVAGGVLPDEGTTLTGQRRTTFGATSVQQLLAVPAALPDQTVSCTAIGGGVTNYLVLLDYGPGRFIWVRAQKEPNRCFGPTNGAFRGAAYVGDLLQDTFDRGGWPVLPIEVGCSSAPFRGLAGQERDLVPQGWTRALLCRGGTETALSTDQAQRLVGVLEDMDTQASQDGSSCQRADAPAPFSVVFDYGGPRHIDVTLALGCDPAVLNGSLQASASEDEQREMAAAVED